MHEVPEVFLRGVGILIFQARTVTQVTAELSCWLDAGVVVVVVEGYLGHPGFVVCYRLPR